VGEFLIGILLGLDFRLRQPILSGWTVLGALTLSVGVLALNGTISHEVMRNGLLAIPFGWLIYTLAGWRSAWMGSQQLQFGGEISYGIYLLQLPIGFTLAEGFNHLFHKGGLVPWPLVFVACLVIPAPVFLYFEMPMRNRVLQWFGIRSHREPIPIQRA
jgi:peptidoglycan/LPS O-acetylase OafA/YrhL